MRRYICFILLLLAILSGSQFVFADAGDDLLNVAKNYYQQGKYDIAAGNYDRFLKQYPKHNRKEEAEYYLAECYVELKRYEDAALQYDSLLKNGKNEEYVKQALYSAGELAFVAGKYDIAHPLLRDFVDKYREDPLLVNVLPYMGKIALSYKKEGADEAKHYFTQSIEMFPKGTFIEDSKYGLAQADAYLGNYDAATQIYRDLITKPNNPQAENAEFQLAVLEFERGQSENALRQLSNFLRKYPNASQKNEAYRYIARCYGELKRYDEATKTLALVNPQTDEDTLLRVRCLYGQNRVAEAQQLLRQLSQMPSASSIRDEIRYLQAMMFADQNDWTNAVITLERLLAVQYAPQSRTMTIGYMTAQPPVGMTASEKLNADALLNACSLLVISYASLGDSVRANSAYNAMQPFVQKNSEKHNAIVSKTWDEMNRIPSGGVAQNTANPNPAQNTQNWNTANTDYLNPVETSETGFRPNQGQGNPRPSFNFGNNAETPLAPINSKTPQPSYANQSPKDVTQPSSPNDIFGKTAEPNNSISQNYSQNAQNTQNNSAPASALEISLRDSYLDAKGYYNKKRYEDADATLAEIINQKPSQSLLLDAALLRAKTLNKLKQDQLASEICEQILQTFPDNPKTAEANWISGLIYYSQGKTMRAAKKFQTILDSYPNSEFIDGATYFIAWDELESGHQREAKSLLSKIYANYKDGEFWSHATCTLAQLAYKNGEIDKAEKLVQELLNHPPDKSVLDRVLFLKGQLALEKQNWSIARVSFQTLLENCQDSSLAFHAQRFMTQAQNAQKSTVK